ncbi:MAG: hypothetical protein KDA24_00110 [Deltaproteobacteria bacterium]|nr:hypothetical protein [Deltaproteobacteria bacterium]
MSETIYQGEGTTLFEALADAAKKLGVETPDDMDWAYEREHFRGGAWSVLVKARELDPAVLEARKADEELTSTGKAWLRELLGWFDNGAALRTWRHGDRLVIDIAGAEDGRLLIGREGKNLPAFQHLFGKVMAKSGVEGKVSLDVDGYLGDREAELEDEIREGINRVLNTGDSVTLRRMNGYERHVVHNMVKETEGVKSKSVGEGSFKSVKIKPDDDD